MTKKSFFLAVVTHFPAAATYLSAAATSLSAAATYLPVAAPYLPMAVTYFSRAGKLFPGRRDFSCYRQFFSRRREPLSAATTSSSPGRNIILGNCNSALFGGHFSALNTVFLQPAVVTPVFTKEIASTTRYGFDLFHSCRPTWHNSNPGEAMVFVSLVEGIMVLSASL